MRLGKLIARSPTNTDLESTILDPTIGCLRQNHLNQTLTQRFHACTQYSYNTSATTYQLQARNNWTRPKRNLKVEDVVLLKENQSPRNRWPLGTIVATHPDDQDRVRLVTVLTSNGSKLERPINKIVLLLEAQC